MKAVWVVIAGLLVVGGIVFILTRGDGDETTKPEVSTTKTTTDSELQQETTTNDEHLRDANIGATVDATDQAEATITINDFIFTPTILKVKKGTKVTWVNQGEVRHNVVSATGSPKRGLNSELLANGESYSFTYNETGIYQYFCTPHSNQMRGIVEVVQ